jgi:hypothetical protein
VIEKQKLDQGDLCEIQADFWGDRQDMVWVINIGYVKPGTLALLVNPRDRHDRAHVMIDDRIGMIYSNLVAPAFSEEAHTPISWEDT